MKTLEIKGTLREGTGKRASNKLRKKGNVPCVIYGPEGNTHFSAHENSFLDLVYTHETHLVKLNIDGREIKSIMKDIQFHPVTDKIIHVDFIEVFDKKPVVINVPLNLTGDSTGVKAGGKLRMKRRSLKVKGYPNDIPDFLTIDITNVKINQSVKVGELAFEKLELLDPKISTVLTVASSRVALKSEEEVEEESQEAAETAGETPAEE